jgi:hypothetical protein
MTKTELQNARQEIARLTKEYLQRGGQVTVVGTTQSRDAEVWEEGQVERRAKARKASKAATVSNKKRELFAGTVDI